MPTDKRERQRAARVAKTQAQIYQHKRGQRTRNIRNAAILLVFGLIAAVAISLGTNPGSASKTTDSSSSTSATSSTIKSSVTTAGVGAAVEPTCPPANASARHTYTFSKAFSGCIDPKNAYTATFDTTLGEVVVELDTTRTPKTSESFVALTRYHYYDATKLFRTDPSIGIIQGGSPHTQDNSDPGPGYNVKDEGGKFDFSDPQAPKGPFKYAAGQLIMARSAGPDSSGGQFFFSVTDSVKNLDSQGTYITFGKVTKGLDVLEKILALHVPTGQLGGEPSKEVVITTVTIVEKTISGP
jgi:peptidyl-prolyl cis-trans isomerase B (cyclophilin B)